MSVSAVIIHPRNSLVDVPGRFERLKVAGAIFGLTPLRHKSGKIDRTGRISECDNALMRTTPYQAARVMLTRVVMAQGLGLKIGRVKECVRLSP